jgi:hypothetical protein
MVAPAGTPKAKVEPTPGLLAPALALNKSLSLKFETVKLNQLPTDSIFPMVLKPVSDARTGDGADQASRRPITIKAPANRISRRPRTCITADSMQGILRFKREYGKKGININLVYLSSQRRIILDSKADARDPGYSIAKTIPDIIYKILYLFVFIS